MLKSDINSFSQIGGHAQAKQSSRIANVAYRSFSLVCWMELLLGRSQKKPSAPKSTRTPDASELTFTVLVPEKEIET